MPQLTKKLKAGLLLLAGVLPETRCLQGERVNGAQLLAQGQMFTSNKTEVQASRTYRQMVPTGKVNHGRRLCQAYEQGGRKAVLAYCRPHIEPEHLGKFEAKLSELVPA